MQHLLTEQHKARHAEFKNFVALNVEPFAEAWDREQRIPDHVISMLARAGYLGSSLPPEYGGQGWDIVTFGLLNEAMGRGSSSLTGVLTVQAMVSMALLKWGTEEQKGRWLPPLAKGEMIGAFALTEPCAGSAISQPHRQTRFRPITRRTGWFALRTNQHGLLGIGASERMFPRKRRLRGHAKDR